ncbi:MAG TPA: DinB family protein [Tepidisphaeraceae bacterium]|nr:DinB family protein [Tepidisphaeraceae bacterium]
MAFDKKLIDKYETGGTLLAKSIRNLTPGDLLAAPPPGEKNGRWTIQQVVIHLLDSDLIWASRMKLIIAENNPQILGYDETKFADNLFYDLQDAETAVEIFNLNRRMFAKVLRALPDSAFARTGNHSERGPITLAKCVELEIEHIDHHVKFINAKRAAMKK